jgi:formyl-CoA transferase
MHVVTLSPGQLTGLKALELGQLTAGPFTTKTLADFGAEVVKIKPPTNANRPGTAGSDPLRKWSLLKDVTSVWWQAQSHNKRSLAN